MNAGLTDRTLQEKTEYTHTTHTHAKDIGHLPGRIRDKEIEESLSSVSFGLFSL